MAIRKVTPLLLYSNGPSVGWARALSSLIDEGMAALCMRQWQRAPITVKARGFSATRLARSHKN